MKPGKKIKAEGGRDQVHCVQAVPVSVNVKWIRVWGCSEWVRHGAGKAVSEHEKCPAESNCWRRRLSRQKRIFHAPALSFVSEVNAETVAEALGLNAAGLDVR